MTLTVAGGAGFPIHHCGESDAAGRAHSSHFITEGVLGIGVILAGIVLVTRA